MVENSDKNSNSYTTAMLSSLSQQLAASFEMLSTAIESATQEIWISGKPPFWQTAFHITNSVDFYFSTFGLTHPVDEYVLPEDMQKHVGKGNFDKNVEIIISKEEELNFLQSTRSRIRNYFSGTLIDQLDDESGFHWLPMNKYELIIYNIRHIMEHTAILNQLLKQHGQKAAGWVGIAEL